MSRSMAEGRLRQVQLIAGARQAADVSNGGDEAEVANFELH